MQMHDQIQWSYLCRWKEAKKKIQCKFKVGQKLRMREITEFEAFGHDFYVVLGRGGLLDDTSHEGRKSSSFV